MGAECNALAEDLDRDPFMRDHVGLVRWGIRRHLAMYDDVRQADAAKNAVTMAIRGHDPSKGKFSTYLNGAFRWARIDAARRFRLDLRSAEWNLGGMEYDPPSAEQDVGARVEAETLLGKLDERARDIVRRVVMYGQTQREAGRAHGVSGERARQIIEKALATMREESHA